MCVPVCMFMSENYFRKSLSPCGFWDLNSGCQAFEMSALPTEPSHQPESVRS